MKFFQHHVLQQLLVDISPPVLIFFLKQVLRHSTSAQGEGSTAPSHGLPKMCIPAICPRGPALLFYTAFSIPTGLLQGGCSSGSVAPSPQNSGKPSPPAKTCEPPPGALLCPQRHSPPAPATPQIHPCDPGLCLPPSTSSCLSIPVPRRLPPPGTSRAETWQHTEHLAAGRDLQGSQ